MGPRSRARTPTGWASCRRAADALRDDARRRARRPPSACARPATRGEGGDRTLRDRRRRRGRRVRASSTRCTPRARASRAVSEERGTVDFGGDGDRSWSSTRSTARSTPSAGCRTTRSRSRSPTAPTMADVVVRLRATTSGRARSGSRARGEGAWLDGAPLDPTLGERRAPRRASSSCSGSSRPTRAGSREAADALGRAAPPAARDRRRSPSTLCQVAAARLDGMVTLRRCRAVDAAAGQLIVREAGGLVAFTALRRPARRAAGPRAALAGGRRAHAEGCAVAERAARVPRRASRRRLTGLSFLAHRAVRRVDCPTGLAGDRLAAAS